MIADVMTQAFDPLLRKNVFIRFLLSVRVFIPPVNIEGPAGPSMLDLQAAAPPFLFNDFQPVGAVSVVLLVEKAKLGTGGDGHVIDAGSLAAHGGFAFHVLIQRHTGN